MLRTLSLVAAVTCLVGLFLLINPEGTEQPGFRITTRSAGEESSLAHIAAAATFDSRRNQMIIFGEMEPTVEGGQLTTYDPQKDEFGTIETGDATPTGVVYPSLVYDPKRDALFLFGGWSRNSDEPTNELWTLSLGGQERPEWRMLLQEKQSPPARNGAVMVLDVSGDRLLLHGGDGGPHPKYGFTPLDDLWTYDLTRGEWERLDPTGTPPEPRWNHCAAIDNDSGRVFVFGGAGYTAQEQLVRDRDVFVLDLKSMAWTRLPCSTPRPGPVQGAALTLDSRARALVLVGGLSISDSGESGTTSVWVYDLANSTWSEQEGIDPAHRRAHTAVYDSNGGQHIVHGGETARIAGNFYEHGEPLHDTIILSLAQTQ